MAIATQLKQVKKKKDKALIRDTVKGMLNLPTMLILGVIFLCFAIGYGMAYQTYISILLTVIILALFKFDEFYVVLGALMMFLDQFQITWSLPVYRIYSYLIVIKFLLEISKFKFRISLFPALSVFALFAVFAVGVKFNIRFGLNLFADVLVVYIVLAKLYANPKLMRKFFVVFVFAAIAAGVFSIATHNVIEYEIGRNGVRSEEIVRYCATFGDPNYSGFYYNIAIFVVLNLKSFARLYLKIPLLLILTYFLLLTNSITAFMCMAILMCVYIVLRYRLKSIPIFAVAAVAMTIVILVILAVPALNQIGFINNVIIRVSEQLRYLKSGRMDMFTSDRTFIWKYFGDFYKEQGIINKLFGGNVVTSMVTEAHFTKHAAVHQSYLQGLLNFGIIGAVIVFLTVGIRFVYNSIAYLMKRFAYEQNDIFRIALISTVAWLFFGFSIDYFLDWRFMFFFFL